MRGGPPLVKAEASIGDKLGIESRANGVLLEVGALRWHEKCVRPETQGIVLGAFEAPTSIGTRLQLDAAISSAEFLGMSLRTTRRSERLGGLPLEAASDQRARRATLDTVIEYERGNAVLRQTTGLRDEVEALRRILRIAAPQRFHGVASARAA